MALNIKHPEADRLARKLAAVTGETLTEAVVNSLRERLAHQPRRLAPRSAKEVLEEARVRLSRVPVRDPRTAEAILGYDRHGLPR